MDTELVRQAQDGDREAFAALVPPAVERLLPVRFVPMTGEAQDSG